MPIPAQRDPEQTRDVLARWLAAQMPAARGLSVSPLAGPAATGYSNETLIFDASWTENGAPRSEGYVVRVKPRAYSLFLESDFDFQYRVMRTLAERTDVPIPRMYWYEEDETLLGAPFYAMARVAGQVPGDNPPFTVDGWLHEAAPAEQERLYWSGLEAMASVHRLDWRTLGLGFLDKPARGEPGLDQQLDYYRDYFRWAARGRAQPIAEAAFEWVLAHRPAGSQPVELCWGDSRIGNMIFEGFECRAVLDWEMVTLGDPVQDLGWWVFLDRFHSEGIGVPRLPGFPSYAATIARWEELTHRRATHVAFYEVFAGLRFAVIMMRLSQLLIEFEVLPPDSDLERNNPVTVLLAKMLELPLELLTPTSA
jgi:aminoglycoside phosphotransferase (APT) family kinase protein